MPKVSKAGAAEIDKVDEALRPLMVPISSLSLDPRNARLHPEQNMKVIKESLSRYGQTKPVVVSKQTMTVVAGNGTLRAAKELGWTRIAANLKEMTDAEAINYGLADNRSAELAEWNLEVLGQLDAILRDAGDAPCGWTMDELEILRVNDWSAPSEDASSGSTDQEAKVKLSDRFLIPPFSVLDARQGYWQDRKRAWLALGIQSELGRGDTPKTASHGAEPSNGLLGFSEQARSHYRVSPGGSPRPAATLGKDGKTVRGDSTGKPLARTFGSGKPGDLATGFKGKAGNRAIKDHAWPATHGKKIPQAGIETPATLGAIAPNQGGKDGILTSPGKYAKPAAVGTGAQLYGAYSQNDDTSRRDAAAQPQSGTSIFDPVLCEIAYRWFSPGDGRVLDPFAGGSVRGIVAARLGREYVGVELNPAQIEANEKQAEVIVPDNRPIWVEGDARDAQTVAPGEYDFLFSCPPYADLERYSDDPRDLSTMGYEDFLAHYREIVLACSAMLADDRFACFVVGDVRDRKTGMYRNFVADTIQAFLDAGLSLYNEAILVTSVGSLPIRVGRQFSKYRKLGKTHQNVLVFVKGNPTKAAETCGEVDVSGGLEKVEVEPGEESRDEVS